MNKRNGFTLIEVLIAMVVLAVGLLGLAALQVASLRSNQSAYLRTQATQLAYDMSDRMRVNRAGVTAGNYSKGTATTNNCVANTCTPAQMAGYDIAQWDAALAAQLPGGEGIVCKDSTTPDDGNSKAAHNCDDAGSTYTIKIWWEDDRADADQDGNTTKRFVMSLQL